MGIRIKKILGYGLVDVQTENYEIIDPRFNQKWIDNMWNNDENKTIEGFFEFAHQEAKKREFNLGLHLYKDASFIDGKPDLDNFITYDFEYGLPNVLVITPITGTEWKRYDDNLDYYQERSLYKYSSCNPHFEVLDVPLYPYDYYINNETGERADNIVREMIYQIRNATIDIKTGHKPEKVERYYEIIRLALKKLGCKMHWTEKWNVAIPQEIQDYCRYMEIFKDESTMWKLQPLIYTYWS